MMPRKDASSSRSSISAQHFEHRRFSTLLTFVVILAFSADQIHRGSQSLALLTSEELGVFYIRQDRTVIFP